MLDKAHRLNKHGSFAYVYRNGKKVRAADLVLIYTPAKTARVGFSVSNKVGKAVVRNKVKRRLRAITAQSLSAMRGCQAIVLANPSAAERGYAELKSELELLFKKAELI